MPRFAANLTMMFTEVPFLERFRAAADAGFEAVEYLFPYDHPAEDVAAALTRAGLSQALFNAPAGNWGEGERGIAALDGREEEFHAGIGQALHYAAALDCRQIHVMAGIPEDAAAPETAERYIRRIRQAADRAAEVGCQVLIEPINHIDMPGYFLSSVRQGLAMVERIGHSNVSLQLDLYHAQITDGDITRLIRSSIDVVSHVQIASVPDRHEPDTGELNYGYVLSELDRVGYTGWVGCEYHPAGRTEAGLGWMSGFSGSGRGIGT